MWARNARWLATVVVVLAAAVGFAVRRPTRRATPEQVRDRVVRAVEAGDAEALCRLADPNGPDGAGITTETARRWLDERARRLGRRSRFLSGPIRVHLRALGHAGEIALSYKAEWAYYQAARGDEPLRVPVVLHRDGRWYLNLGEFLAPGCNPPPGDARHPAQATLGVAH